jgi:hypothetical protein
MEDSFYEFLDNIDAAQGRGKQMKMPRFTKNLRVDREGIYSYGTKIAQLDIPTRSIIRTGYYSPTSSRHYNYMRNHLEGFGFSEVS